MPNNKKKKKNKKMAIKKNPSVKNTQVKKVVKKKKKKKKGKKKLHRTRNYLLITVMIGLIGLFILAIGFASYVVFTAPKFEEKKFYNSESTILLDVNGKEIAKLGSNKRELITYDELPQVFIDALIATEDSRYFQHNGFDIARFLKASLGQVSGQSDAGGGSTITMQISKNYLTNTRTRGFEGIVRKFTDIYLAIFKIEKDYTKEEIIEFYINRPYLGAGVYGVEEAARTYFGKSVRNVSLPEAALIVGLFQAPDAYNPFKNPESANKRKNTVLNLMARHGYISNDQKLLAQSVDVKDIIIPTASNANKYISFIDTVTAEVLKETGKDPYNVPMIISTTMDPKVQDVVNDVTNGVTHKYVNDVVQLGVAVTSVKDGSIVAIGGGRNKVGEKTLNFATQIRRHAGSTAKPYTVYAPGIEFLKWSSGTPFFDESWSYSNGGSLKNADGKYNGFMTLEKALAKSRNIPAIQGFQQLDQKEVLKFIRSMGINISTPGEDEMYESSAIGGVDGVSPLEQSAAYGTFGRNGVYIKPYSFTKIIFRDDESEYEHVVTREKVMEPQTAFIINKVLKKAVDDGLIGNTKISGTDLCGKTGTSTFDSEFRSKVGLPASSIMDSWVVMYSPDYATAQWYGYEKMTKEMVTKNEYLVSSAGVRARKSIAQALTNGIMKNSSRFEPVSGIKQITIELETLPLALPSANTPDSLKSSEWFVSGSEPTEVSKRFETLSNVTNIKHEYNPLTGSLTLTWNQVALPEMLTEEGIKNYWENGFGYFSANMSKKLDSKITALVKKYQNKRIEYNTSNIGNLVYKVYAENNGNLTLLGTVSGSSFTYNTYSPNNQKIVIKTAYSISSGMASSGTNYTITTSNPYNPPVPPPTDQPSSSQTTIEIRLRGQDPNKIAVSPGGTYTDLANPLNVIDDNVNVTSKSTITVSFLDINKKSIAKIPLDSPGTFYVNYSILYNNIKYEATRTVIVQ